MEPGNRRGLGAAGGAVVAALIVAVVVLLMVNLGGGLRRPMFAQPPHGDGAGVAKPRLIFRFRARPR